MTIFRSEDLIMGVVSLAIVPWIAWTLRRGLKAGRLPLGRAHVTYAERPGAFATLLVLYVFAAFSMGWIGLDLLTGGALSA